MADPRTDNPRQDPSHGDGAQQGPSSALGSSPRLGHGPTRREATYGEAHEGPDERRGVHLGERDVTDTHGHFRSRTWQRAERTNGERSLFGLLSGVASDIGRLVRKEGELARTELREKLDQVRAGATAVGTGAFVTYAGVLFLILSVVLMVDEALNRPWLSTLIVGGIVTIVGLILLGRGRSSLKAGNLTPERTLHSLKKDAALATDRTTSHGPSATTRETTHAHP